MDDMQQLAMLADVTPFGAQVMQAYPATIGGFNPQGSGRSNWTTNEDTKG